MQYFLASVFMSSCGDDSSTGAGEGGGGYQATGGITPAADGGGACENITQDTFIHENLSWQVDKTHMFLIVPYPLRHTDGYTAAWL